MSFQTDEQKLAELEDKLAEQETKVALAEASVAEQRKIKNGGTLLGDVADPYPTNSRVCEAIDADSVVDFDTDNATFDQWREAFDVFESGGHIDCRLSIDDGGTGRDGSHYPGSVELTGMRLRSNKEEMELLEQQLAHARAELIRLRNQRDEILERLAKRDRDREASAAERQKRAEWQAEIMADPEYAEFARLNAKFVKKGVRGASFK